jgi:predicted nuclease of restriction endonuclease-like (RecB) superfamily
VPSDVLQAPFELEFLDLKENRTALESDLEQAISNRLEDFLLELGARTAASLQGRRACALEGDHFHIDLFLYNRLLGCFVLMNLKLSKLMNQDLGQMQTYLSFYERFQCAEHEAKTIDRPSLRQE